MQSASPHTPDLTALLANNILFAGIEPALLSTIAEHIDYLSIKQNTIIFLQGEEANGLYLIVEGTVEIFSEHGPSRAVLSHSGKDHLFGEFLTCGNSMRSTSAIAYTNCDLLFWPLAAFSDLLAQQPNDINIITSRLIRRLGWNQTMLALRLCKLFIGLNENIVRDLINHLTIKSVPANTLLIKQHDQADDMCIVINGQFEISKTNDEDQKQFISLIGRGETVGEMGLICGTTRAADVKAVRDSNVAYLNRGAFEELLLRYPLEINRTFVRSIITHFDKIPLDKPNTAESFALINLSSQLDPDVFLHALLAGLQLQGSARVLTSQIVDQAFMTRNAAQSDFSSLESTALVQWLSEQELVHQHVVYFADPTLSHWTRRCLRQADHVLFLVDHCESPAISGFEAQVLAEMQNNARKKTLIIQHDYAAKHPHGTSTWLHTRELDSHYHVRQHRQEDFNRLARFLTGNALGLVMGGGAARGFAHIGVLKALKELNIEVDLVGGNSMGALLAAEFALQWDEKKMLETTRKLCLQGDKLTLPLVSLYSGKIMTNALKNLFGELHIEDLWIPFFCVSCNISRAKLMTHRQGTLLAALLSSNAPPGLFPPQINNGDLLVDGALLNNLPIDIMRELNQGGRIIAIDVNKREDLLYNSDSLGGLSGWHLLWNRINPLATTVNMPGLIQILTRSSMIGGLAQQKRMHTGFADLYLQPPVTDFPLMGYAQAQAIADAGYHYAIQRLANWLEQKTSPD